jgi:hypothetical protein
MRVVKWIWAGVVLVLMLAGAGLAETVFVTEPKAKLWPRSGRRVSAIRTAEWPESFERLETVGQWSRVRLTKTKDAYVWSAFLATYELTERKTVAEGHRAAYFTVERYLATPVLKRICEDVLDREKAEIEGMKELIIEGYLASDYPDGDPLCVARWSSRPKTGGGDSALKVDCPEEEPLSERDQQVYERLGEMFRSASWGGKSLFELDTLWVQVAEEFDITPLEARYIYDRVRWSRVLGDE